MFLIVAFFVRQIFGIVRSQIYIYIYIVNILIKADAKLEEFEGCFDKNEIKDM
jgi:hypothetical protein